MNTVKTAFFLGLLTILLLLIGELLGGKTGIIIAFVFALIMNFTSYYFSDKIALSMYKARETNKEQSPLLYEIVRKLTERARLPMPKLYIIPSQSPNAFATGRNPHHAAVAVTEGALNLLSKEELMGVLGHELGHVKHRDILIGSVAATVAGAIMIVASMARWAAIFGGFGRSNDNEGGGIIGLIVVAILAPIAAMLVQMAISRTREYAADKTGAIFSGNPLYLANALEKLHTYSRSVPLKNAQLSTAHMFIVNPLSGKTLANLFSTHPPIEERIKRLKKMTLSF